MRTRAPSAAASTSTSPPLPPPPSRSGPTRSRAVTSVKTLDARELLGDAAKVEWHAADPDAPSELPKPKAGPFKRVRPSRRPAAPARVRRASRRWWLRTELLALAWRFANNLLKGNL